MQTHDDLVQGTAPWHAHRAKFKNASDAPAAMGCSPYKTRSQFLHERFTGMPAEVDAATQARFDDGHRFEALALGLAQNIAGCEFYQLVGTLDGFSASFDGISLDESTITEHKTLNDDIRRATCAADLPEYLRVQMEQQLFVSGAERCLFLASKWDANDDLVEEVHHWYVPDLGLRARIIAAWAQFEKDLAEYVPVEVVPAAIATPTMGLPALSIQVDGSISLISNLEVFGSKLNSFVDNLDLQPSTDQGFADAEAAVKTLQKAQDALEAAESSALAQTASIDEMRRTVALYVDVARKARLALQNAVKIRKEAIRVEIRQEAIELFTAHVAHLNKRIGKPYVNVPTPDIAAVMKGLKTVTSLRNAVDTLMANTKIEANAIADKIEINLASLRELAKDHAFLFSDTAQIVTKANDDLVALIKSRIADHAAAEAKKAEELRIKIAAEERAKAEAKLRAEQEAEDNLIASFQKNANRIEFDSVASIQKAINYFESGAKDWDSDPRPRVVAALIAAREQMQQRLASAQARELAEQTEREAIAAGHRQQAALEAAQVQRGVDAETPHSIALTDAFQRAITHGTSAVLYGGDGSAKVVDIQLPPPALTLGKIGARLGFSLTADFLRSIGFEPAGRERSAVLYHESSFPAICAALIAHINRAQQPQEQAA